MEKNYLKELAEKATFFYETCLDAYNYIHVNAIRESNLKSELIYTSALWASNKLNTKITEVELEYYFGLIPKNKSVFNPIEIAEIKSLDQELTLYETLDMYVDAQK